ncbi:MAG: dihydroorotase [Candidatus Omnitrophota bacterium]
MSNSDILIKNGRVVDPANGRDGAFDVLITGGRITKVEKGITKKSAVVIDASGMIVTPGLIDMHVHLREPGREDIETVRSGTRTAAAGGITSVCAMPNTMPPIDTGQMVRHLAGIIKKDAAANVYIVGAVTRHREGREIVDIGSIKREGAIALSDDGNSVQDASVMSAALEKARDQAMLIISHCEDTAISKNGVVNEGIIATKLGLRSIPKRSEYEFVKRDIELAKKANARIHIAHVSCKESVEIIRAAKKDGVAVTAETAPHYFTLYDEYCSKYDTRTKMNPPLRSTDDVKAVIRGLADGTIDAIASDHAPHGKHEKEIEFEFAAFGIIGLETLLPLSISQLIDHEVVTWSRLVELVAANPAKILGRVKKGSLSVGSDADITVIDPHCPWEYLKEDIVSQSKNSPFIDWQMSARARDVIVGGKIVLRNSALV